MELRDGIHSLPVSLEIADEEAEIDEMELHPAAVETERGILLIDTGFPPMIDQIEAYLAEEGFGIEDVWAVVVTHQDVDHVSGLAELLDRADPVVFAHESCAPYIDGRKHPVKMDDERYPPQRVDVELTAGSRIATTAGPMEVVFTPGHAPGHMSLYFPEASLLVSGDALHAPETELDGPRYPHEEEPAIESVGRLAELEVTGTLTYHHGFVEHDADRIETIWQDAREDAE